MVYIQKQLPPSNKIFPFTIQNFNGGMNNRSLNLASNEASDLRNMMFYDNDTLEKRKGTKAHIASYFTDMYLRFIDEYKPYTGTDQLIRGGDTKVEFDVLGTITTQTVANRIDGENFMGKYFFVDGDKMRVYGTFPTVSDTYTRIVGTPSGAVNIMTVVSTPNTYTPLGTSYTRGVTVYDYTNKQVWYEPCQKEKDDPYLGLSVIPSGLRYLTSLRGRLFATGCDKDDDNVFITAVSNPYYFAVALPIQLPPNSDLVMGLATYDDSVVIGRKNDIHAIIGMTNNPTLGMDLFELKKLNTHTGFANNQSINIVHNFLFFIGYDGNCYALSSTRSDSHILSTTQLNKTIDFMIQPFYLTLEDIQSAVTGFFDNAWYVSINNWVFVYFYERQAWTVLSGLKAKCFYVRNNKLIWGTYATGLSRAGISEFSTDYLDYGNPYSCFWESAPLDMGDPSSYKQFRDVYLYAYMYSGYDSQIRVSFELDYAEVSNSFTILNQMARWGVAKFGEKFNSKPINASLPFTIGRRARTIKVRFENSYNWTGVFADLNTIKAYEYKKKDECYQSGADGFYYVYDEPNNAYIPYTASQLNQPMRVLQINGEYELRGKR